MTPPVQPVGDPLGRVYTPVWLADEMARIAGIVVPDCYLAVDPCCGQGALMDAAERRWPTAKVVGIDIDPGARGARADYLEWPDAFKGDLPTAYLINPPYDDVGWRILRKAVAADPEVVVALVPLPWIGHQKARGLIHGERPATIIPILGRPWTRLREAVLLVWRGTGIDGGDLPRCVERPKGVRSEA